MTVTLLLARLKVLQKLQVRGVRGGVAVCIGELFHTDQVLNGGDAEEA